jgi:hypothetical protein
VVQDLSCDTRLGNESDDPHWATAAVTNERTDYENPSNQISPPSTNCGPARLAEGGLIVRICIAVIGTFVFLWMDETAASHGVGIVTTIEK